MTPGDLSFLKMLHRAVAATEEAVDGVRRAAWGASGRHRPRQIVACRGYADAFSIRVMGRVLANQPSGGPLDDDRWWKNLINTWRRWESDEVPFAGLTLRFEGREMAVTADEEGYYSGEFPLAPSAGDALKWVEVHATAGSGGDRVEAVHEVMVTPPEAAFGIISDLDDTVIHTGITSLLLAAKLTFLENARTRKPLEGVAGLYQALQCGHAHKPLNPLFYLSSSPWNLHDLLIDFLRLNDIPPGPVLLRDIGIDRTKFIKEKGHGHKRAKALDLLDAFPRLPFVLIGDSGQQDPAIYAEVARVRPGRILAIYIRDIDPEFDSERDTAVHRAVGQATAAGVPMILARDSRTIAEHARGLGLIPTSAIGEVRREVAADQARPETGVQALQDAVESLVTGEA
jgi:phosphatidate phosphatase APP1